MIDLHNHSLFGQDDGAKTFEDAVKMLTMAYDSGTRVIMLTPHKNHPFDFQKTIDADEAYIKLCLIAQDKFPGLTLLRGNEYYITQMNSDVIEALNCSKLGASDYVLIEFSTMATLEFMLSAIHEIRIAGMNPIVAHIEVYQSINGNTKAVEALKNEGTLVQITGSSLIGKRGKTTAQWLMSLIEKGLIEFVASDGHGLESRRPVLDKAREYLQHKVGSQAVEVLLEKNPRAVIDNMPLSHFNKNKQKFQSKKTHRKKQTSRTAVATLSLMAVAVVTAGMVMAMNPQVREQIGFYKEDVLGIKSSERITGKTASGTEGSQLADGKAMGTGNLGKEASSTKTAMNQHQGGTSAAANAGATGVNDQTGVVVSPTETEDALVEKYKAQLTALQVYYESKLKSQVIMAREELKKVNSKEDQNKLYVKYADQISALESQSDEDVQAVLYDLQTALEAQKLPIDSVKLAREEYAHIKSARRDYYTGLLKR